MNCISTLNLKNRINLTNLLVLHRKVEFLCVIKRESLIAQGIYNDCFCAFFKYECLEIMCDIYDNYDVNKEGTAYGEEEKYNN